MKRLIGLIALLLPVFIILSAYSGGGHHASSVKEDLMKKWLNTFSVIEQVDADGNVLSGDVIYPNGFFKLNENMTYDRVSDGVPLSGTWNMHGKRLALDFGGPNERIFDILMLSVDSLVIQRSDGATRFTQHYKVLRAQPQTVPVDSAHVSK